MKPVQPVQAPGGSPVLIVSPDERWLRALEVTIRLGGYRVLARHSLADVMRVRDGEDLPQAMVFDLGANWTAQELESVRALIAETTVPAVVILPERLASERDRVAGAGATTLIRPYRPSELFAVLPPHPTEPWDAPVEPGEPGEPATPPAGAADEPISGDPATGPAADPADEPATPEKPGA